MVSAFTALLNYLEDIDARDDDVINIEFVSMSTKVETKTTVKEFRNFAKRE